MIELIVLLAFCIPLVISLKMSHEMDKQMKDIETMLKNPIEDYENLKPEENEQ